MSTVSNARTRFLDHVASSGWDLDPTQTIKRYIAGSRYGMGVGSRYEDEQNPHAFKREVFDPETGQWAGRWHIDLDYSRGSGYVTAGTTLRRVTLSYTPVEGERRQIGILRNVNNRRATGFYHSDLWEVTGLDADGDTIYNAQNDELSLRERAEKLVTNPALVAWLAVESEHQRKLRAAEQAEQRKRDTEERLRPLPVTVEQWRFDGEWNQLARRLQSAAQEIGRANGQSDLPALIAKVDEALGNVIQVLNPEARDALDALMADYATAVALHSSEASEN